MKHHTTKENVNNGYPVRIKAGYCNLRYLLAYHESFAYTSDENGWNADIYEFGNTVIITGYYPFGNIEPPYEMQRNYDAQAEKIYCSYGMSFEDRKEAIDKLLKDFINQCRLQLNNEQKNRKNKEK